MKSESDEIVRNELKERLQAARSAKPGLISKPRPRPLIKPLPRPQEEPVVEEDDFVPEEFIKGFKPTMTVSVEQKVQVTQYEPARAFISMTIQQDTTADEMDAILATTKIAFRKMAAELKRQVIRLESGEALGRITPLEEM